MKNPYSAFLSRLPIAALLATGLLAPGAALSQPATAGSAASSSVTSSREATANEEDGSFAVDPRLFQALSWRNIGPYRGGRAIAIAGVAQFPDRFYFGAAGGGVWQTDDAGTTWRNISDGFFGTGSVGAIAVAPNDPNVLYVGMGEAPVRGVMTTHGDGVYRSNDGGATWTHLGLEDTRHISRIVIHPNDPETVWVAAQGHLYGPHPDRGIYRSDDGGVSWEKTLFVDPSTGASDLTIDLGNPRVLYAGMWQHQRKPWKIESGGPGSGIWKSVDGGRTWERLEDGLPTDMGKIGVAVSPARPSRIWAIIEADEGGLYRSDDAGKSFTRINEERVLRARAWYYTHITADPISADTVYVLNAPVMRSIDGGITFEQVPTPHGDNHALWINPHDNKLIANANDGGGTISRNGGITWSSIDNQPTAQFYRVITDRRFPYWIYGGQQDNSAIAIRNRSLDRSAITERDWHSLGGCESAYPAMDPDHPRYVYGGCYQGLIDEFDLETGLSRGVMAVPYLGLGAEPKDLAYRFNWNAPIVVSPQNPSVIYHAGNVVLRSDDRGRSWQEISPDLTRDQADRQGPGGGPITNEAAGGETYNTITTLVASTHAADTLWAGTDDGRVHVTTDGGGFWREITPEALEHLAAGDAGTVGTENEPDALESPTETSPTETSPTETSPTEAGHAQINTIELSPHGPDTAYLAVHRFKLDDLTPLIYATTDGGESWSLRTDGLPADKPVRVVREDPARRGLLYAGTESGVFVSFDDGVHWQPLEVGLPNVPITDLTIRDNDLIAATQGRSYWILDDLTPLHNLAVDTELTARLLAPRAVVRTTGGQRDVPGAGTNPPAGAVLHYVLPEPPTDEDASADAQAETASDEDGTGTGAAAEEGTMAPDAADGEPGTEAAEEPDNEQDAEIVLEIADPSGQIVRRISSQPPEDAEEDTPTLATEPGLNRFVWNLRLEPMLAIPDILILGDRGGYRVGPGRYQIRLYQDDDLIGEQPLEVLPDPRIDADFAAYQAQQGLLGRIRDTIQAAHDGVTRMRDVSDQVGALLERLEGFPESDALIEAGEALVDSIDTWQQSVIQPEQKTFQDVINFPNRLNAELFRLLDEVDTIEPLINDGARARFAELDALWQGHANDMQKILDEDLAAFEALLAEHAVPVVLPPPSKLETSDP